MKKLVSMLLAIMMVMSVIPAVAMAEEVTFADVKGNEYYAASAEILAQLGVLTGYEDGSFGADKSITRAEMATIICRMLDKAEDADKAKGETNFEDVAEDHWASGFVNVANKESIINGYLDNTFKPENDVKFEEAVKMVVCALGLDKEVIVDPEDWSKAYLDKAQETKITDNLKGEKGKAATRGDVAVLVKQALVLDVAAPTASVKADTYTSTQKVALTTVTEGAEIYYTTDGSEPTVKSTKYEKEISVSKTTTLKAVTVKKGVLASDVTTVEYVIKASSGGGGGGGSTKYYTVKFNLNYNDATNAPATQKVKKGSKLTEPPAPLRTEYNFIGWSTSKNDEIIFDFNSEITKTITLYAVWEEKSEAQKYYESTSEIIDVINVEESDDVFTETDVNNLLQNKGFTEYPITYKYAINGEYCEEAIALENSSDKHPMYYTDYLSKAGEGWSIYIINGEIFANPISFNLESNLDVLLLISTSESLTSYDEETNRFYVNIPQETAIMIRTVDSIDAATLDSLTIEELCRLSGAVIQPSDIDETYESEDTDLLYYDDTMSYLYSTDNEDPVIVVSLGDSYSSGEGIEPFYGQEKALSEKVEDEDWLAHRSTKSWPSLLQIPGIDGTMSNYRANFGVSSTANCQWYFVATSGAETKHFKNKFTKKYDKDVDGWFNSDLEGSKDLPPQLDVFDNIDGHVDFVTLTIGGNDVGFTKIITTCAKNCSNLHFGSTAEIEDIFKNLWDNFNTTKSNIKKAYQDIATEAGAEAEIIVAGYPKLLNKNGKGAVINKQEAKMVNENVTKFNDKIEEIVNECKLDGINIHFVSVEDEFDGHEAYSENAWINKIIFGAKAEDLDDEWEIASAYSIHPNASGAKAYARCVNAKIAEIIEEKKDKKKISGVITIADTDTDMTNNVPLEGAEVVIKLSSYMDAFAFSNERGEYTLTNIPYGSFNITVSKEGYIPVTETIVVGQYDTEIIYNITIEAIPEAYDGIGYASGTIYDVRTGAPVSGLTLYIREGLENTTGDVVCMIEMNDSSQYSTTHGLSAGNYTIQVVDERTGISDEERYITSSFNIKILGEMTIRNQNGYVSNGIEIEELRIVLTWGSTPSDLDSHLVGPTTEGGKFHVFYADKEYGTAANLDVDDTSSYGPETITIHDFNEGIYTYAIHDYSNKNYSYSTSMANSGAQVKVYRGAELLVTYNVPANMDGTLWTVFTYDSRTKQITPINTMSYDSSSGGSLMSLEYSDDIISIIEEDIANNFKEEFEIEIEEVETEPKKIEIEAEEVIEKTQAIFEEEQVGIEEVE